MNWEAEVEMRGGVSLTVGEMQEALIAQLKQDELEEFAGELIKFAELSPAPLRLGD